ncbi:MAG: SPOR domain-containing protein [Rubrivivax sp.]|nr:SPOR domain-containing protein [Rubrivivax sp.]
MRIPFLRPKPPAASARTRPVAARAERERAAAPAEDPASVEAARTRARRRLVGALVLLMIGVVGFPVLFETQPRPLPVDTPIEVSAREMAVVAPAPKPAGPLQPPPVLPVLPVPPADAGNEAVAAPSAPASVAAAAVAAVAASAAPPATAPASGGRFVVQVGAYTDAATLREARAKVEKTGLKTYTQVIQTDAGQRTRVRVGPFTTRQEAEGVAAKIKRSGLPANVIAL